MKINTFNTTATVALSYEETGKNSQRISKSKRFVNIYNWKIINYLSGLADWKRFEKTNLTIAQKLIRKDNLPTFPNTTQSVKNKFKMVKNSIFWQY